MFALQRVEILQLIFICFSLSQAESKKEICTDFRNIQRIKTAYCDNFFISTLYEHIENVKSTNKYLTHKIKLFKIRSNDNSTCLSKRQREASVYKTHRIHRSCATALVHGEGTYLISSPDSGSKPIRAYCIKDPNNGTGWTIIQRRVNDVTSFAQNWDSYEKGFGEFHNNFWIGLQNIYALTSSQPHELWIEMKDSVNKSYSVRYDYFAIGSNYTKYALQVLGKFDGTIGNALFLHQGRQFSTIDQYNEQGNRCGEKKKTGWWYPDNCGKCNLNGLQDQTGKEKNTDFFWGVSTKTTLYLSYTQMAIRQKFEDFCT